MHTFTVDYRPDDYPQWVPWREFEQRFTIIGDAGAIDIGGVPTASPGFAPRVSFGKPPDGCDDLETKRELRRGFQFQVRFRGTGHVSIIRFRLHAKVLIERSRATC